MPLCLVRMIEFYEALDGRINEQSNVLLVSFSQGWTEGDAYKQGNGMLDGTLNLKK